jgi:hypothetical protein
LEFTKPKSQCKVDHFELHIPKRSRRHNNKIENNLELVIKPKEKQKNNFSFSQFDHNIVNVRPRSYVSHNNLSFEIGARARDSKQDIVSQTEINVIPNVPKNFKKAIRLNSIKRFTLIADEIRNKDKKEITHEQDISIIAPKGVSMAEDVTEEDHIYGRRMLQLPTIKPEEHNNLIVEGLNDIFKMEDIDNNYDKIKKKLLELRK